MLILGFLSLASSAVAGAWAVGILVGVRLIFAGSGMLMFGTAPAAVEPQQ